MLSSLIHNLFPSGGWAIGGNALVSIPTLVVLSWNHRKTIEEKIENAVRRAHIQFGISGGFGEAPGIRGKSKAPCDGGSRGESAGESGVSGVAGSGNTVEG